MKYKNKKFKEKFILVVKICYESTKAVGFRWGSLKEACIAYGSKYDIKYNTLQPYVSYVKTYNNVNNKSFKMRQWYFNIIVIINPLEKDEIIKLINIVENTEEDFDLLNYLKETYENC